MFEPGTVLMGKYRVERTIGRGGMGVVVAAEHVELRTQVALKFLAERFAARADVVERFVREARACAQLRSDHICRVTDVGRLDTGVPYFVMELLAGADLAEVLRTRGRIDAQTAADYLWQACDAIGEAHAAQIIHRDLKPANLFLTRRRDGGALIKVLDFGVAKAAADQDHNITSADAVMGSPTYMAPEQIRGARHADPRSDIWSLGIILYELVAGLPPFRGETVADLAVRIATDPLPPLRGVPPALAAVIARCLDKEPARRYQSAEALAAALEPFVPMLPVRGSGSRPPPPPVYSEEMTAVRPLAPTEMGSMPPASALLPLVAAAATTMGSASGMSQPVRSLPVERASRRWLVIGAAVSVVIGVGAGILVHVGGGGGGGTHEAVVPGATPVEMPVVRAAPDAAVAVPDAAVVIAPADAGAPDETAVAPPDAPPPRPRKKQKTKEQVGASRI